MMTYAVIIARRESARCPGFILLSHNDLIYAFLLGNIGSESYFLDFLIKTTTLIHIEKLSPYRHGLRVKHM